MADTQLAKRLSVKIQWGRIYNVVHDRQFVYIETSNRSHFWAPYQNYYIDLGNGFLRKATRDELARFRPEQDQRMNFLPGKSDKNKDIALIWFSDHEILEDEK